MRLPAVWFDHVLRRRPLFILTSLELLALPVKCDPIFRGSGKRGWPQPREASSSGSECARDPGVLRMIRCAIHCTISLDERVLQDAAGPENRHLVWPRRCSTQVPFAIYLRLAVRWPTIHFLPLHKSIELAGVGSRNAVLSRPRDNRGDSFTTRRVPVRCAEDVPGQRST
jgi:hypothetical protein